MNGSSGRKKITWCAGLESPCPIGMHPRVDSINKAIVDGDFDTVAAHFNVEISDLNRHSIDTHHLPWDDPKNKIKNARVNSQEQTNADRADILENLEEFVTAPHKYYPKMQKILTRIMIDRLGENSLADISKFSKEVRENFRAMAELPINEDLEVNIAKEYEFFFNLVTMKACPACTLMFLDEMEQYRDITPLEPAQIEEDVKKAVTKQVIRKIDMRTMKKHG